MLEFVTTEHSTRIGSMFEPDDGALLAVSYWGEGAFKKLDLDRCNPKTTIVICDLMSGACNPKEIEKLRAAKFTVLKFSKLHAKIYWTSRAVYIGSANASANGLGFEGDNGNVEAGIISTEKKYINEIKVWVESLAAKASVVTDADVKEASVAWRKRQVTRDRLVAYERRPSLLAQPDDFFKNKQIFLWVYDAHYSPATEKVVKNKRKDFGKFLDAYECSPRGKPKNGSLIIDVFATRKKARCEGIFQIIDEIPAMKVSDEYVVFCKKTNMIDGVKMTASDRRAIEQYVKRKYLSKVKHKDGLDIEEQIKTMREINRLTAEAE
jgi:hypothetical protein